jgi:hypothetical protein
VKYPPMLYLGYMKIITILATFFIVLIFSALSLSDSNHVLADSVFSMPPVVEMTSTPMPNVINISMEATATVDPASIGDTSGVIAIGMIVVLIILVGVLWGSREINMGTHKTKE